MIGAREAKNISERYITTDEILNMCGEIITEAAQRGAVETTLVLYNCLESNVSEAADNLRYLGYVVIISQLNDENTSFSIKIDWNIPDDD